MESKESYQPVYIEGTIVEVQIDPIDVEQRIRGRGNVSGFRNIKSIPTLVIFGCHFGTYNSLSFKWHQD